MSIRLTNPLVYLLGILSANFVLPSVTANAAQSAGCKILLLRANTAKTAAARATATRDFRNRCQVGPQSSSPHRVLEVAPRQNTAVVNRSSVSAGKRKVAGIVRTLVASARRRTNRRRTPYYRPNEEYADDQTAQPSYPSAPSQAFRPTQPTYQARPQPREDRWCRPAYLRDLPGEKAEIKRHYPRKAQDEGVDGTATVSCLVGYGGYYSDCTVTEEEPQGYGFATAALEIFRLGTSSLPVECSSTVSIDESIRSRYGRVSKRIRFAIEK